MTTLRQMGAKIGSRVRFIEDPEGQWRTVKTDAELDYEHLLPWVVEDNARLEELEAKLAAIDDLMVRRIKHHQEMKDLGGSGMAVKREHYKLHVLSETLGEIRKVTKARTTSAELKGQGE